MAQRHNHNRRRNSYKGKDPLTQDPQDVMSTAMRLQWNIRVLQRHDPAITTIVDQFTYAVLYRYEEDRWVKRGVEGSMFVYTRTDPPRHGFCILNREGAGNFVQPLRRGDELEVTADYIIFRPADVGADEFHHFIGIWTADLDERRRLSDFMQKIQAHISKSDVPYSPVLLYQPLDRPEDAALPLITPLPPPPGSTPKKGRRGEKKSQQQPHQSQTPQVQPIPPQPPVQNGSGTTESALDTLFAKFAAPSTGGTTATTTPSIVEPATTELRGPALLQSMFASAAAGSEAGTGLGGLLTASTSTTSSTTSATPVTGTAQSTTHSTEQTSQTSTVMALPSAPAAGDGVTQGNMLKQLLGIPIQAPAATGSATVADLSPAAVSATPPRPSSTVPPGFKPINEDEEHTPPGTSRPSTPPNKFARAVDEQTTPTPTSKAQRSRPNRELVAYDFEDGAEIVSPWLDEPLQRPRPENVIPPSPSQFPQPKAVREKKKKNAGRRNASPKLLQQQQQQEQPRQTYVPRNSNAAEGGQKIDMNVAADAIMAALNGPGDPGPMLSKDQFAQELLGLIHRTDGFVDVVYGKYVAMIHSRQDDGQGEDENIIYLD